MSNEPMQHALSSLKHRAQMNGMISHHAEELAGMKPGNAAGSPHCSFFIAHCFLCDLRRSSLLLLLLLLLPASSFAQTYTFGSDALENPPLHKPGFVHDSTFEFGIFDKGGARIATAYYRILKEETEGRKVWRFKYVGRNAGSSESSECVVDVDNLQPIRSTRKVVYNNQTYYSDVAYQADQIVVREKRDETQPMERSFPKAGGTYDYEELMWLVPLLDFGDGTAVKINVFDSLNLLPLTVSINDEGIAPVDIQGKSFSGHKFSFRIQQSPYTLWSVMQDGREVPAKINMGDREFINLELSSKKEGKRPAAGGS